jgi:hypothetical protein
MTPVRKGSKPSPILRQPESRVSAKSRLEAGHDVIMQPSNCVQRPNTGPMSYVVPVLNGFREVIGLQSRREDISNERKDVCRIVRRPSSGRVTVIVKFQFRPIPV